MNIKESLFRDQLQSLVNHVIDSDMSAVMSCDILKASQKDASKQFYMYVDECGDQNLAGYDEKFPIFTLCGIIMSLEQRNKMEDLINDLKIRIWGNTDVIFHSHEIRKRDGAFHVLNDDHLRKEFYEGLDEILKRKDLYKIVCCSILKKPYIKEYGRLNDIYAQSLSFLIERAIFYIDDLCPEGNCDLRVILEMRGKKSDKQLYDQYEKLRWKGTYWLTPERLQNRVKKVSFEPKKDNIVGLQVADLVAYPFTRYILNPQREALAFEVVKDNLYVSDGKLLGVKIIPKEVESI